MKAKTKVRFIVFIAYPLYNYKVLPNYYFY